VSENNKTSLNKGLVLSALMEREDLSDEELRVALKILSRRDDSNGWCQIAQASLADYMRIPQQTVNRIVGKLRAKKVIVTTWTYDRTTMRRGSTQYFFLCDLHFLNRMVTENSVSKLVEEDFLAVKEKINNNGSIPKFSKEK
jgi:transcription initiation factor IIE alpha subunit